MSFLGGGDQFGFLKRDKNRFAGSLSGFSGNNTLSGVTSSRFLEGTEGLGNKIFRQPSGPNQISFADSIKLGNLMNNKDNRSFRDKFTSGLDEGKSYADSFKKDQGKDRLAGTIFGGGNAASAQLTPNLSIYDERTLYPTGIIQGQAGTPGLFSSA